MNDNGDGTWSISLGIEGNQTIEFKFINGNAWGLDEIIPATCATGLNRSAEILDTATTLDLVCFGSCTVCVTEEILGCTNPLANNYNPLATEDDSSCIFECGPEICGIGTIWDEGIGQCIVLPNVCPEDVNGNGIVSVADLLIIVSSLGINCP